jgi:hypothetical protein
MTSQEFLDLSTRLAKDLQTWVTEAAKDDLLSSAELETLRSAAQILERGTLREAGLPNDPPRGPVLL